MDINILSDVFNVALLQLSPTDSIENNMLKGIEYCKKAKGMGADIAVFQKCGILDMKCYLKEI